ncbi:hypothetical protein F8388_022618 [Cannabis sativa]|uniref:DUF4283 domain-containing protein n=1 Tax=Cannabis sativa TaxID=3483 RepID=A0A7J6G288_CANSA|nr:hypothetical protein F8388_022618 [Cannabis sativa]
MESAGNALTTEVTNDTVPPVDGGISDEDTRMNNTLAEEADDPTTEVGVMDEVRLQFIDSIRPIARGRLRDILSKIWTLTGKWRMKTMKLGLWGIFFDREADKKEVLRKRPWMVNGLMLNIRDWPKDGRWEEVNMSKARLWVEAHGLPTPYLTWENTSFYLNIFKDRKEWVQFKYHKLPAICFNCGYLAHSYAKCNRPTKYAYPSIGKAVPLYGAWIKVGVPIKNCFDPRIPRIKLPEKTVVPGGQASSFKGDKGKKVIPCSDNDPSMESS